MKHLLVRYGEIGKKSNYVRDKMLDVLRQRVEDRLEYEESEYDRVSKQPSRIIISEVDTKLKEEIAELPGVSSVSPAIRTEADIESLKEVSERFEYGETFGIVANRAGKHEFSSKDAKVEVGSHVEEFSGASVDLDSPETLLGIDIRHENAYVYTERVEGPDGLPVGTQRPLAALISGGIDSPVAAYEVMKRGSPVTPIYFYNRPIAAEDHWIRLKSVVNELKRFHPSQKWEVHRVDMEKVNEKLMEVKRGRMVLHRMVMFEVADRIAKEEGLDGIVTGESLGQKSSQTVSNLSLSSEYNIHRPLLAWNKNDIVEKAKQIGTFEKAKIDSACRSLAPDNPAASLQESDLEELKDEVGFEELVETAVNSTKKITV